jgi:CRP-like cAMP-binding protein
MSEALLEFLYSIVPPEERDIPKGGFVFQPGEAPIYLFGLKSGAVRMVRYNIGGDEILIYRAAAGQTFAEASLFSDVYHCAVIADSACRLLRFPKDQIMAEMDSKPPLLHRYAALMSRQVRELRTMLEIRSIRSAGERLLYYLHLRAGPDGRCHIDMPLIELAELLGLAHETLYRVMKKLEDDGLLRRNGKMIMVERGVSIL